MRCKRNCKVVCYGIRHVDDSKVSYLLIAVTKQRRDYKKGIYMRHVVDLVVVTVCCYCCYCAWLANDSKVSYLLIVFQTTRLQKRDLYEAC